MVSFFEYNNNVGLILLFEVAENLVKYCASFLLKELLPLK